MRVLFRLNDARNSTRERGHVARSGPRTDRRQIPVQFYSRRHDPSGIIQRALHPESARPGGNLLSNFSRLFHDTPFSYDLGVLGRDYDAYDALIAGIRRQPLYDALGPELSGQLSNGTLA
jgi:hypothetical protein